MTSMKIILLTIFAAAAGLILLTGQLYPQVENWSFLAAGACAIHALLSLIVSSCKMADAGRIAAWCWQGISTMLSIGLLLLFNLRNEKGWFLASATLVAFTLLVTLVFALILKPDINSEQ
jgi:hypothetical protein